MILTAGVGHLLLIAVILLLLTYYNVHIGTKRDIRELPLTTVSKNLIAIQNV